MKYTDEEITKKRTGVIIILLTMCLLAQILMICRIYGVDRYDRKKPGQGRLYQKFRRQHENLIDETASVEKALPPVLHPDTGAMTTGGLSCGRIINIKNQLLKYYECTARQFKKERGA